MSSPMERRSPFLRLLDAFLQEENIKWVLGLGVCILLGSSLRLVTLHWVEYTPVWKYLILVGYSVTIFVLGEFSYQRLGLRKTGTVLKALTVLLIPISFLALHWIQPKDETTVVQGLHHVGMATLLGLNLIWSAYASWRIFTHFLRRPQPTFFVSYLILCIAGAVVPGLPASWGLGLGLLLWAVFTVGTVKVNRHIFWLTEEQKLPRIFGFFPILLLGAQFAAVFLLGIAGHVTPPWMGLLCTLISLPVLMTADTVARVFEQRNGGLVRPIPWSISGPLALGTLLSAGGVILAMVGFPASPAVVPTAVIAAIAMGIVAQRTQQKAFVWGMLVCIAIGYQTCPVFFKELVLQVRDQAAAAVREQRLPYAFYGLTYAPLIIVFTLTAARLRRLGNTLFAAPFQSAATVLPCLLLPAAFTHPSAILPVSLILCPLFVIQAVLFRSQYYLAPASVAFLAAAYGGPLFATRVWGWTVSANDALMLWTAASGLLMLPGAFIDRFVQRRSQPVDSESSFAVNDICQWYSLAGAIVAATTWMVEFALPISTPALGTGLLEGTLIGLLLAVHAMRWLKTGLGELTLAFSTYVVFQGLIPTPANPLSGVETATWLLLGQWILGHLLHRIQETRIARAFGPAAFRISACGLSVLSLVYLAIWGLQHVGMKSHLQLTSIAMIAWGLDTSRRLNNRTFATLAWGSVFVYVTATLTSFVEVVDVAQPWWMFAWTGTGLVLMVVYQVIRSMQPAGEDSVEEGKSAVSCVPAWVQPLEVMLPLLFLSVGVFSLPFLGWPQRAAGLLALGGLWFAPKSHLPQNLNEMAIPLANWQMLAACFAIWSGMNGLIFEVTKPQLLYCGLPVAALAAISLVAFESKRLRHLLTNVELLDVHQIGLLVVSVVLLHASVPWTSAAVWQSADASWAVVAWFSLATAAVTRAIRLQNTPCVWLAEATVVAAFTYFHVAGVLHLNNAIVEFLLLFGGIALWSIGQSITSGSRLQVLAKPFEQSGYWLPLAVLPIAILRQSGNIETSWVGANSLPLLGAAMFYFWRGMERRQLGTTMLSAVLLNIACLFFWNDLHWTDPQFFLIPLGISVLAITELMNREIPAAYHDRLRFVGSLMILVSPTFNIVTGSWLHILTLMIASALLALVAIGLRVRVLLYTSTAFLLADLVALVARGSVDEPNVLWITGVALGALIIALGAACENHRETILARLRGLAAELEQWA